MIAVGTNEGTVLLIDTRDAQILQEIEVTRGAPGSVYGVVFLAGDQLAVLCHDGNVIFFSPRYPA